MVTDAAAVYPAVLDELVPSAWHHVERYANNPIEADHSQLKHRLRPMRGLRTDRTAQVIIAGHAFMQNLRRGHYELGVDAPPARRVAAAFTELVDAISPVARLERLHVLRSASGAGCSPVGPTCRCGRTTSPTIQPVVGGRGCAPDRGNAPIRHMLVSSLLDSGYGVHEVAERLGPRPGNAHALLHPSKRGPPTPGRRPRRSTYHWPDAVHRSDRPSVPPSQKADGPRPFGSSVG